MPQPTTLREAHDIARNEWDYVYAVEEVATKPGTVVRRTESRLAQYYGAPISQQFKVRLHSSTGPLHWIVVLDDGTPLVE